ncbi:MAG TPA: hypothetical protein VHW64_20205, partial [Nocardioides sp.]|uniref:WD40/YVTN/BNR-like repeat-containing protein n=1 Tax=Nocardioides sp. TaxID=35761 RepID=UPI002E54DC28|nr:hypothetical protein [Nocardioides sp.]
SPTPQGNDLDAVTFQGSTGYAVGKFGTALRSTDGGATWSGLPTGTFNELGLVQELDPNTVIVGGGCSVAESTNGGARFTELPINSSTSSCNDPVSGLSFTSATTGYVEQQSGQIEFTNDGGQSVQAKTPVPVPNDGQSHAQGLQFVSPTVGFGVTGAPSAGTIQRTTDGANSWTQVASIAHGLNDLTFVTPTTAFAVGDKGTLVESTDAGATWMTRPLAGAGTPDLAHIACSDALNCLISIADSRSLIRTTDGGATGATVTPSARTLADVAFSTGTNVVGVGGAGATVLSADGGASFPTLVSGGFQGAISDSANSPLRAGGAAGNAFLLGLGGNLEATTDGGTTWKLLRIPGGGDLVDAAFPNATNGYTVGNDGVLRKTTNGGTAWSSLDAGVSDSTSLAATSATNVLLVGPVGIRRSTDGGQTFTKVSGKVKATGTGKHKKAGPKISSLKLSHSLTVGRNVFVWSRSVAYESTNGGSAWQALPLPAKTKIIDLSFVSPSAGYVLDLAGDVLGTRNRGKTWTKVFSLGVDSASGLSFSSPQSGVVALEGQGSDESLAFDVLATTNGGKTWQPEVIDGGGSTGALSVVLATRGHDYFADPDSQGADATSAVFATGNGGASPQASHLSISIGPKKLTAKALKSKHHNRVTIKGKLNPVTAAGEQVQVSRRGPNGRSWTSTLVNVASNGAFQVTLKNVNSTTDFVVYAVGDGVHGGAGAYARLTVTR